eukprot:TRINITY_DN78368_c0_g1_i1.p1 TRINITY_DN78368_c0_g1~~TRINITY_DN78368_c0_g1_i1.p1  ORF type:complete len:220 (+),score=35.66 TRINITY_DN78368_c0_g1_i1:51-662(+)
MVEKHVLLCVDVCQRCGTDLVRDVEPNQWNDTLDDCPQDKSGLCTECEKDVADEEAKRLKARAIAEAADSWVKKRNGDKGMVCKSCHGLGKYVETRGLLKLKKNCRDCKGAGYFAVQLIVQLSVSLTPDADLEIVAWSLTGCELARFQIPESQLQCAHLRAQLAEAVNLRPRDLTVVLDNGHILEDDDSIDIILRLVHETAAT